MVGIEYKLLRAGWDTEFLLQVLGCSVHSAGGGRCDCLDLHPFNPGRADPRDPRFPSLANPHASPSRFEPSNTTSKYYLVMH